MEYQRDHSASTSEVTADPGTAEYYQQMRDAARAVSKVAAVVQRASARQRAWARGRPGDPRFWTRVTPSETGCWEWTGSIDTHGYGQVRRDGQRELTHRLAWRLVNGEIPPGLVVCHRCDNPRCVRTEPEGAGHLFLGTMRDNTQDSMRKGRHGSQKQAGKRRGPYRPAR